MTQSENYNIILRRLAAALSPLPLPFSPPLSSPAPEFTVLLLLLQLLLLLRNGAELFACLTSLLPFSLSLSLSLSLDAATPAALTLLTPAPRFAETAGNAPTAEAGTDECLRPA